MFRWRTMDFNLRFTSDVFSGFQYRGGMGVAFRKCEPHGRFADAEKAGGDGAPGRTLVNGEEQPAKVTKQLRAGDLIRIETPGGGGYG